jgi:hypothetical protein
MRENEKKIERMISYLEYINPCIPATPRYAKIQYHTRTHVTCFGNTAGLPVLVLNTINWIQK